MPEGTLLPTSATSAANIAASSQHDAMSPAPASGDESGSQSFRDVLHTEMSRPPGRPEKEVARAGDETSAEAANPSGMTRIEAFLGLGADAAAVMAATMVRGERGVATSVKDDVLATGARGPGRGSLERIVRSDRTLPEREGPETTRPGTTEDPAAVAIGGSFSSVRDEARVAGGGADVAPKALRGLTAVVDSAGPAAQAGARPEGQQPVLSATGVASVATAAPQTASPAQASVTTPLGAPGWQASFADQVSVVVQTRQPAAEIQLNPPNLGPVEIKVTMTGDQANVQFFSAHAPVREAIQSAMPRLGDALAASGLSLGEAFVGADPRAGQQGADHRDGRGNRHSAHGEVRVDAASGPGEVRWRGPISGLRAVDLFA